MLNKIKLYLASIMGAIMFSISAAVPATVMAVDCTSGATPDSTTTNQCLCNGTYIDFSNATRDCSTGSTGIGKLIRTIINVLSVLIGAIAVIMIIIGGFRYIVSSGNPEQAKNARNTILYAIIGLVIVALAQIIVHFVLNNTNNATSGP